MIAYDHDGGSIAVGPHPDVTGWSDRYQSTVGACFLKAKTASYEANLIQMLVEFHHAVVRDGVPVRAAHAAFWNVDEYREAMAADVPKPRAVLDHVERRKVSP